MITSSSISDVHNVQRKVCYCRDCYLAGVSPTFVSKDPKHVYMVYIVVSPEPMQPVPNMLFGANDIFFVVLAPVLETREADFGRTIVHGKDPIKKQVRATLEYVQNEAKSRFQDKTDMTSEIYV